MPRSDWPTLAVASLALLAAFAGVAEVMPMLAAGLPDGGDAVVATEPSVMLLAYAYGA